MLVRVVTVVRQQYNDDKIGKISNNIMLVVRVLMVVAIRAAIR